MVLAAGSVETIPSLFSIERDEERSSKTRRKEAISWRTSHIERRSITVNNRGTMESGEERREGGRKTGVMPGLIDSPVHRLLQYRHAPWFLARACRAIVLYVLPRDLASPRPMFPRLRRPL